LIRKQRKTKGAISLRKSEVTWRTKCVPSF